MHYQCISEVMKEGKIRHYHSFPQPRIIFHTKLQLILYITKDIIGTLFGTVTIKYGEDYYETPDALCHAGTQRESTPLKGIIHNYTYRFYHILYAKYFNYFRKGSEMISEERQNVLEKNKERLKKAIKLKKTLLLDKLHERNVITLEDKENIEVRNKKMKKVN